ncbi:hypothetical protein WN944_028905 [Citrus x changshan-huyou]|uniref:Uncharacterized protein n=1 Tax=Citrus x changshan-huyou TaxID=2935761 RepID=A0AAP0QEC8_9ROSI
MRVLGKRESKGTHDNANLIDENTKRYGVLQFWKQVSEAICLKWLYNHAQQMLDEMTPQESRVSSLVNSLSF